MIQRRLPSFAAIIVLANMLLVHTLTMPVIAPFPDPTSVTSTRLETAFNSDVISKRNADDYFAPLATAIVALALLAVFVFGLLLWLIGLSLCPDVVCGERCINCCDCTCCFSQGISSMEWDECCMCWRDSTHQDRRQQDDIELQPSRGEPWGVPNEGVPYLARPLPVHVHSGYL